MTEQDTSASPEKIGRYEIVRELGRGAMGVVYEGRDPNIGRRVAIKTARRDVMELSGMADEMMERFLREARAAGTLNHPNIITIYDAGEEEGMAYMAMEFLDGGDLSDMLRDRYRPGIDEVVSIGVAICEALAVAHAQGIVHRDIKPANILTPAQGKVKVADFGIAHMSDSSLTREGALIGTPHYMSPEQFMGQKIDGRSDLFSVGNILYELLTGEKPFGGEALSTVMHQVIKSEPIPPKELNFSVNDALNQVIMKAMAKRPDERYLDAGSMAAALKESLKANPNPDILAGGALEAEATVMSVAEAGDATKMGELMSETVPSSAFTDGAGTETMAGATTFSSDAAPGTDSIITKEDQPWYVKYKTGFVAAGAMLIVIIASLVVFSGGNTTDSVGDDGDIQNNVAGTAVPDTTPPQVIHVQVHGQEADSQVDIPAGPFFGRFRADIFTTTTPESFDQYDKGLLSDEEVKEYLIPPDQIGLEIELVFYDDKGEIIKQVTDYISGRYVQLDGTHRSLRVEAKHNRMTTPEPVFSGSATSEKQAYTADMIILPPGT